MSYIIQLKNEYLSNIGPTHCQNQDLSEENRREVEVSNFDLDWSHSKIIKHWSLCLGTLQKYIRHCRIQFITFTYPIILHN